MTSIIPSVQTVAEISGRVKDVLKTKKIIVITKSGKSYTVDLSNYFCPTHVNDLIYAKCNFENNDTESTNLIMIANPFVLIPHDEASIKDVILSQIKKNRLR